MPHRLLVWGLQTSQTGSPPWEDMFQRGSHRSEEMATVQGGKCQRQGSRTALNLGVHRDYGPFLLEDGAADEGTSDSRAQRPQFSARRGRPFSPTRHEGQTCHTVVTRRHLKYKIPLTNSSHRQMEGGYIFRTEEFMQTLCPLGGSRTPSSFGVGCVCCLLPQRTVWEGGK